MSHASAPELLTLHAVRLLGFADATRVAARYGQPSPEVMERLLDDEACGLVARHDFGGSSGWSLTALGRIRDDENLLAELDRTGARTAVAAAYEDFLPLNAGFLTAITDWQLRRLPGGEAVPNDHVDSRWDDDVYRRLRRGLPALRELETPLRAALPRFAGYRERYETALQRAESGSTEWIDGIGLDSLHTVWMQLHQDLLTTLGITREDEASRC